MVSHCLQVQTIVLLRQLLSCHYDLADSWKDVEFSFMPFTCSRYTVIAVTVDDRFTYSDNMYTLLIIDFCRNLYDTIPFLGVGCILLAIGLLVVLEMPYLLV